MIRENDAEGPSRTGSGQDHPHSSRQFGSRFDTGQAGTHHDDGYPAREFGPARQRLKMTEAAFDLGRTWTPAEGGASGAHVPAQQVPADNCTDSQTWSEHADGEAVYASPCGSLRYTEQPISGGAGN
jgi:hypothetical protein